jgi:signal transduction histidine kinase
MTSINQYSISKQLTWMNVLVSGAALLLACAAFFAYDIITYRESLIRNLSIQAQIIGSNTASALLFNDPRSAENTLSALQAAQHILYAGVYTPDGAPLAVYWRDHQGPIPALPALPANQVQIYRFQSGQVILVRSIVFQGKTIGTVYLRAELRALYDRLKNYSEIVGIVFLLCLIATGLISWRAQRVISAPLMSLSETARSVSRDTNYSVRVTAGDGHNEITTLIEAFNEMLSQIQSRNAALEQAQNLLEMRVKERTAALERAETNLRALSRQLLRAQDEERRRIARELHEGSGQVLAALTMNLSVIQAEAAKWGSPAVLTVAESLRMVESILRELRTMSYLLHPPLLEEAGVESALHWFVEGFSERSKIPVKLDIAPDLGRLPRNVEIAIFRIVQESLTNIHRHSQSPRANIRISRNSENIRLEVQDYGKGIAGAGKNSGQLRRGVGIQGMEERVRQLNGQLEIETGSEGTTVRAIIPVSEGDNGPEPELG